MDKKFDNNWSKLPESKTIFECSNMNGKNFSIDETSKPSNSGNKSERSDKYRGIDRIVQNRNILIIFCIKELAYFR